ncbi:uncharacterized protein TNCV_3062471 [Trichonephila clavipes]|nr:uncharacterized protein TNCV_3062471 [Trichonephila clavipes]
MKSVCRASNMYSKKSLQEIVQAGGGPEIVLSMCSWHEKGPLIRLDLTMTGQRYISILSDHMHPIMSCVHSDGRGRFLQDNEPPPGLQ